MSTSGNGAVIDSMNEINVDPEQKPQGTSPAPLLGSRFEVGAEDNRNRLRTTQHVARDTSRPSTSALRGSSYEIRGARGRQIWPPFGIGVT